MSSYLEIRGNKLKENCQYLLKKCSEMEINLTAVVKCFSGNREMVQLMVEAGIKSIADARIQNLADLDDIDVEKILLRMPSYEELDDIAEYVDITMISEIDG